VLHFEAGGEIGEHETGFGQLVVVGAGWAVSGSDHSEVEIGDAVFLPRGVMHAKGSESAMTVVMIEMYDLKPSHESRNRLDH